MNDLQILAERAIAQVKTVISTTKTAAVVIFVTGLVAGCVIF